MDSSWSRTPSFLPLPLLHRPPLRLWPNVQNPVHTSSRPLQSSSNGSYQTPTVVPRFSFHSATNVRLGVILGQLDDDYPLPHKEERSSVSMDGEVTGTCQVVLLCRRPGILKRLRFLNESLGEEKYARGRVTRSHEHLGDFDTGTGVSLFLPLHGRRHEVTIST